jgi:hypothetical protein
MQYTLFTNKFGRLNTYLDAEQVGPDGSVVSLRIDTTQGPLKPRIADLALSTSPDSTIIPGSSKTIVPFANRAVGMDGRYAVAIWGSRLYRSHKGFRPFANTDINCVQYTKDIEPGDLTAQPVWDCLGLSAPSAAPTTALAAGGSLAVDTYTYVVTFYNALGHESLPSAVSVARTTTSGTQTINLTNIPLFYGAITTTNGSPNATIAEPAYISSLRVGMRIVGPSIPAGTIVTSATQSGDPRNIVLSQNATGGAAGFRDEQIIGRRIYRRSNASSAYQLVNQLNDMTTTSWSDNGSAVAGRLIDTLASTPIPLFSRDASISPGGVMTFVQQDGNIAYLNIGSNNLYRPDRVIRPPDSPMASIYALGRFIFPSKRGAFSLSIEDVTGIPIISMIDADEASEGSFNVYCVDTGGEVWWNTSKGLMSTDGLSIKPVTRYTHSVNRNKAMKDAFGALNYNGDIYFYTRRDLTNNYGVIYIYNPQSGWSEAEIIPNTSLDDHGTLGTHLGNGFAVFSRGPGSSGVYPYSFAFFGSPTRMTGAQYRTGEWVGEKASQLKKFRKVSILYEQSTPPSPESPAVQVFIDGVQTQVISVQLPDTTRKTRFSFWLPPETKGRTLSLSFDLASTTAIDEVGVWVGEQRGPMP